MTVPVLQDAAASGSALPATSYPTVKNKYELLPQLLTYTLYMLDTPSFCQVVAVLHTMLGVNSRRRTVQICKQITARLMYLIVIVTKQSHRLAEQSLL